MSKSRVAITKRPAALVIVLIVGGMSLAACGGSSSTRSSSSTGSTTTSMSSTVSSLPEPQSSSPAHSGSTVAKRGKTSRTSTTSGSIDAKQGKGSTEKPTSGSNQAKRGKTSRTSTTSGSIDAKQGKGSTEKPTSGTFVAQAGFAFGTFHRYVYEPFTTGALSYPTDRKRRLAEAGAATLAVLREVGTAKQDAQGSAAERQLFAPMAGLQAILYTLGTKLKHDHLDRPDIESANGAIGGIERAADSTGLKITETSPAAAP